MLALYRSGRQAEALEAYQDARRALVDELGIEPGRALRELQQAILEQDPALDLAAAARAPARRGRAGSFVGRERELGELRAGLDDALAGRGRLFLLVGEPGIGKSRLAEELIAQARARGARVLVGRCWEAGGAPAYWPWVQALRAYVARDASRDALRAQLGARRRRARDAPARACANCSPTSRARRRRLARARGSGCSSRRRVLPAERASSQRRWRSSSTTCTRRTSRRCCCCGSSPASSPTQPLLIVGCCRDTEIGPRLAATLAELAREPATRRITLKG